MAPRVLDPDEIIAIVHELAGGTVGLVEKLFLCRVIALRLKTTHKKAEEALYDIGGEGKLLVLHSGAGGRHLSQLKSDWTTGKRRFVWDTLDSLPRGISTRCLNERGHLVKGKADNEAADGSVWVTTPERWAPIAELLIAEHEEAAKKGRALRLAKKAELQSRHGEDLRYIRGLLAQVGVEDERSFAHLNDSGDVLLDVSLKNGQITALAELLKNAGIVPVD